MADWRERRVGPLLTMWAAAGVFIAALAWLQHEQPALDEVLPLIYAITAGVLVWSTIKWLRARPTDRTDRRRTDRRHDLDHDQ